MKLRKQWDELFFRLSDGDAAAIQQLKGMEEIEFFNLFEQYQKKIELQIQAHRNV